MNPRAKGLRNFNRLTMNKAKSGIIAYSSCTQRIFGVTMDRISFRLRTIPCIYKLHRCSARSIGNPQKYSRTADTLEEHSINIPL